MVPKDDGTRALATTSSPKLVHRHIRVYSSNNKPSYSSEKVGNKTIHKIPLGQPVQAPPRHLPTQNIILARELQATYATIKELKKIKKADTLSFTLHSLQTSSNKYSPREIQLSYIFVQYSIDIKYFITTCRFIMAALGTTQRPISILRFINGLLMIYQ